jgi:hypothetical protein
MFQELQHSTDIPLLLLVATHENLIAQTQSQLAQNTQNFTGHDFSLLITSDVNFVVPSGHRFAEKIFTTFSFST